MRHAQGVSTRALLLIASAIGCSGATPIGPTTETAKSAPLIVGNYKLTVSTRHEISCSQSFQSDSELTSYELSIAADGAATLARKAHASSVFGPSESKFGGGAASHSETSRSATYACHAKPSEGATRVECVEQKTSGKVTLVCRTTTVELDDGKAKTRLDAIACSGLPGQPDDAAAYFKGAAPLASGTGLLLAVDDYGHGSAHTTLRKGY